MPTSKKKGKGKGGRAKSGSSVATGGTNTSSTKPPRTNDEIMAGKVFDDNRPPKKALVRELQDALLYEVNSDSRAQIIAKVADLEDPDGIKDGSEDAENTILEQVKVSMPITYESKGMLDFPGNCLLTVGRTAPFHVEKVYHGKPHKLIQLFQNDKEQLEEALKWTGEQPVINVLFPQWQLCGKDSNVFLGECYLDKEDIAYFSARFKHPGTSPFTWPNTWGVLQCPFTCTMAVPDTDKKANPKRYIMILQNLRQVSTTGNRIAFPYRAFPRLCDKEYFEKNFRGGLENVETEFVRKLPPSVEWCKYPQLLKEGLFHRAGKKMIPSRFIGEDDTVSVEYLPSAHTLFAMYHQSGMCAAVSQVIDDKQGAMAKKVFPNATQTSETF